MAVHFTNILKFGFCLLLTVNQGWAQVVPVQSLSGEYLLEGVMETAAGFRIKNDQTFEYFFIYGAADKYGKGTWKLVGNHLVLNSYHAQPAADFTLINSAAKRGKGITIKITDAQGHKYPYVICRFSEKEGTEATTDENGQAHFETIGSGVLELYHPIFSTRVTQIKLNPKHTEFIIYPAYDLSETYFKDFEMQVQVNQLSSNSLPGMPPEGGSRQKRYDFIKQK